MAEAQTILVLGGPAAGKSVFLSVLYHRLWNGDPTMVMRAANGAMHGELLSQADKLTKGTMPPATQALRPLEFELERNGRTYHLSSLDYPGELFRRVFFDLAVDTEEAQQLYSACRSAHGIILLWDPQAIIEQNAEADFTVLNFLKFLQTASPVPKFVLAFTKRDQNHSAMNGNAVAFVRTHLPHSARLLGRGTRVMHFCSIVRRDEQIELALRQAVRAPLECLIEEMEQDQLARIRSANLRRHAFHVATRRGLAALGLVSLIFGAFVLGIWVRLATN